LQEVVPIKNAYATVDSNKYKSIDGPEEDAYVLSPHLGLSIDVSY